jgi:hypothetical protein
MQYTDLLRYNNPGQKGTPSVTDQRLRIVFSNLPPRASPLADAELQKVFGGCRYQGQSCSGMFQGCCPKLVCNKPPYAIGYETYCYPS